MSTPLRERIPSKGRSIMAGLFVGLLFGTSLVISPSFIDPLVMGKHFYFFFSLALLCLWLLIDFLISDQNRPVYINQSDFWLGIFLLYGIFSALTRVCPWTIKFSDNLSQFSGEKYTSSAYINP
jgi:drug/metabolite transporter (DMT)-like permease